MNRLLDFLAGAALVLDSGGRVLEANSAAEAILSEREAPILRRNGDSRLEAGLQNASKPLDRAVQGALIEGNGSCMARLVNNDGSPVGVICTPLQGTGYTAHAESLVLVSIADPRGRARDARQVLTGCFGLTAAEAKVASLVGCGMGNPEIANHLGISRETVKRHLAQIFAKTDARTQANLARLISQMLHS